MVKVMALASRAQINARHRRPGLDLVLGLLFWDRARQMAFLKFANVLRRSDMGSCKELGCHGVVIVLIRPRVWRRLHQPRNHGISCGDLLAVLHELDLEVVPFLKHPHAEIKLDVVLPDHVLAPMPTGLYHCWVEKEDNKEQKTLNAGNKAGSITKIILLCGATGQGQVDKDLDTARERDGHWVECLAKDRSHERALPCPQYFATFDR